MKTLLIVFLIVNVAKSMTVEEFEKEYKKIIDASVHDLAQCKIQYEEIVLKAFKNNAENGDKLPDDKIFEFEKDEKKALEFISKFDPRKTWVMTLPKTYKLILANCNELNGKKFFDLEAGQDSCSNIFDELYFQYAALYAVKNYQWKKSTVARIKDMIIKNVETQTQNTEAPLVSHMISISVLGVMFEVNIIDKKLKNEYDQFSKKAEEMHSNFKKSLPSFDKGKTPSCDTSRKNSLEERRIASIVRNDLVNFIKKIKP